MRRVASIIEASPYYSGTLDTPYHPVDVTDRPRLAPWTPPRRPWKAPDHGFVYYDNYFVPRGYAVVLVDEAGTNRSTGCPSGPDATGTSVAVINWLNGRGHGYSTLSGGHEVTADWSSGKVGMFGKSNDAEFAIDTAADAKEFFDAYSERNGKRYKVSGPVDSSSQPRIYETSEGLVSIELRDKDVVMIEGASDREQLARLAERVWQSKKK